MQKHKYWMICLALWWGNGAAMAQQTYHLSLQQALEMASKNNLQIKNALLDVANQKQVNREVTASAFPKVSANGRWMDNLILQTQLLPGEFFGAPAGTFIPITFGTKYLTTATADVSQLLFDGQVFVALKARNGTMDLQRQIARLTEVNIRSNIYKIYYQLVVSKTQIQLLDSTIGLVQKMKNDIQIMYDNGFVEKLDIDKNEVQLSNLITQREKVVVGIANGYNGLKILLGIPAKDHLVLTDDISDEQLSEDVLSNAQFQYSDRQEFKILEISRDLNKLNKKRYQYSKLPTLSAFYNYGLQYMGNTVNYEVNNNDKKWFRSSYVGINLSIPIFNGFATNARIKQAQIAVQKNENEISNMRIQIDAELENAKNIYTNAIATIAFQKKNMALAQNVYHQTKKKYEIGTGSQTEVYNARNEMQTAQANFFTAMYDAVVAKTDYLKALGQL